MPWTIKDVSKHNKKATTKRLKELWVRVANRVLKETKNDVIAIIEANKAIIRELKRLRGKKK